MLPGPLYKLLVVGEKHSSFGPVISQVGVAVIVTAFEHCDGTPVNVVIKLIVKLPGADAAVMLTVGSLGDPIIPALPVTVQK
jgi:hypothetical protein